MRKLFCTLVFLLMMTSCGTNPTSTINVTMDDFLYDPIKLTVSPGDEIAFKVTNRGTIVHDFVIMKLGKSAGPIFGGEDAANIYWQAEIAPGHLWRLPLSLLPNQVNMKLSVASPVIFRRV